MYVCVCVCVCVCVLYVCVCVCCVTHVSIGTHVHASPRICFCARISLNNHSPSLSRSRSLSPLPPLSLLPLLSLRRAAARTASRWAHSCADVQSLSGRIKHVRERARERASEREPESERARESPYADARWDRLKPPNRQSLNPTPSRFFSLTWHLRTLHMQLASNSTNTTKLSGAVRSQGTNSQKYSLFGLYVKVSEGH